MHVWFQMFIILFQGMCNADFYLLVKFWAQASMMKQCFCQNNNSILLAELFQHLTYMIILEKFWNIKFSYLSFCYSFELSAVNNWHSWDQLEENDNTMTAKYFQNDSSQYFTEMMITAKGWHCLNFQLSVSLITIKCCLHSTCLGPNNNRKLLTIFLIAPNHLTICCAFWMGILFLSCCKIPTPKIKFLAH